MALENVAGILHMADKANTSVIAFNCSDYNMVKAAIETADEVRKPILCMLDPNHARKLHWIEPVPYAAMVREIAAKATVPVGLHLDHCSDFEYIVACMKAGFNSVMYDGSMLPVEENIRNTREVVRVAKVFGVSVEAELGHVGFADNQVDQNNLDLYTKPETASRFCEECGCDSVAVAIGSAHGFYKQTPKLDLKRLEEINQATDVPLVLHGGSGIPEDQLKLAFTKGINKFNVGTEYFYLYFQTVQKYCKEQHKDIFDMPGVVQNALKEYLRKKLELCKLTLA